MDLLAAYDDEAADEQERKSTETVVADSNSSNSSVSSTADSVSSGARSSKSTSSISNTADSTPAASNHATPAVKLPAPSLLTLPSHSTRPAPTANLSLHAGRKRTFEHVEGNWPTAVQIDLTVTSELTEAIQYCMCHYLDSTWYHLKAEDLHLSLSRTVTLRYHEIDPFVSLLRKKIGTLDW